MSVVDDVAGWLLEEALDAALTAEEQQRLDRPDTGATVAESEVRRRHEQLTAETGELVVVDGV